MKRVSIQKALKVAAVAACCLSSSYVVAAKYYKWVDEKGVTHYSAQPPASGEGEVIKVKSGASSDKDAAMKRLEERRSRLQQDAKDRANPKTDEQAEVDKKNADIVKKNCKAYRKNLKVMTENSRVRMMDKNGEARVLPEEERQQKMQDAKKYIADNCG